jgi:hypothetical protein
MLYPEAAEIFKLSAGNFDEIFQFLHKDNNPDRIAMLKNLTIKDYKDAKADTLESHLTAAGAYRENWKEKGALDIYEKYILCPRILLEELTDYREFIRCYFSEEEKVNFQNNPAKVWKYIKSHIKFESKLDYNTICSTPVGSLKLSYANPISQKILFAAICRTFGIAARLNAVNLEAEFYENGSFIPVSGKQEEAANSTLSESVILYTEPKQSWTYYQTWTIGKFKNDRYETLDYTGLKFTDGILKLNLEPGTYRLITSARMPGGNQHSSAYVFDLEANEEKTVTMRLREGNLEDMLVANTLEDFEALMNSDGTDKKVMASSFTENSANILAFLSEGEEPTEHVLNEMLEQKEVLQKLDAQIFFFVRNQDSLKNPTLQKVLAEIPSICTGYINFEDTVEPLARRMYVDPDKLPLLIVTDPGLKAIYGCSGYNVGSVDLMVKLLGLSAGN